MTTHIHRIDLDANALGDRFACLGSQLIRILTTVRPVVGIARWYYADVEFAGQIRPFVEDVAVRAIGDTGALIDAAAQVDQFLSGVFLASATQRPHFRDMPHTEDPEFAPLGDAVIEIRAFDTSHFEIDCRDDTLARLLADSFGAKIDVRES